MCVCAINPLSAPFSTQNTIRGGPRRGNRYPSHLCRGNLFDILGVCISWLASDNTGPYIVPCQGDMRVWSRMMLHGVARPPHTYPTSYFGIPSRGTIHLGDSLSPTSFYDRQCPLLPLPKNLVETSALPTIKPQLDHPGAWLGGGAKVLGHRLGRWAGGVLYQRQIQPVSGALLPRRNPG